MTEPVNLFKEVPSYEFLAGRFLVGVRTLFDMFLSRKFFLECENSMC
jgi:hypothetical protein